MIVTLIVRSGKNAGQQIRLARPDFLIGRGEQCHLRPRNEAVSRQHCGIFVENDRVVLKDFGSKNGTFVNGRRVVGEAELHTGDLLQVADLVFEILLTQEQTKSSAARPMVGAKGGNAGPSVSGGTGSSSSNEIDLMSVLGPPDLAGSPTKAFDITRERGQSLEETVVGQQEQDTVAGRPGAPQGMIAPPAEGSSETRVVGVAKDRWKPKYANPREAAAEALKKFFGKS